MLDCDASFVLVPEFASIRRPLPSRLTAVTAPSDDPAEGIATPASVPPQGPERQNGESFTLSARPAFIDSLPAFDMPPLPVPPMADLRAEAARGFSPADLAPTLSPEAEDTAPAAEADSDPRPVTPRRPLRFTSARGAEDAAPVTLPSFNLFDGVFEDPALNGPDIDPRLQRSRARARAQLAAMEATLTPVERNLWHDDDPAPMPAPAPLATDEAVAPHPEGAILPRRPVRHIMPADLARRPRPLPQIEDPLRDRLRDLRAILYSPTEEDLAEPVAQPTRLPLPQQMADLAVRMIILVAGLLLTARHALPSRARLPLPALFGPRLTPRLTMAVAALAAVAIPLGLIMPDDLLPFL